MWVLRRRAGLIFVLFIFLITGVIGLWKHVRADDSSNWFSLAAPTVSKVVDVGSDAKGANTDCSENRYVVEGSPHTVCTYQSTLGTLTVEGDIQTGINKYAPLYGPDQRSTFLPWPSIGMGLISLRSPGIGNYLGAYYSLSKSSLVKVDDYPGSHYYVNRQPDAILRDPATGEGIEISDGAVAYSANGEWMVADAPHRGLLRIHLTDLSVQLFAGPVEPSWYLTAPAMSLAISDDGRYVAANTDIFSSTGNLNIYDLSTCEDQLDVGPTQQVWCQGRNILQGQTLQGAPNGQGILTVQPGLQRPERLRFVDDQTLSFDAWYGGVQPSGAYDTANFVVTAPGGVTHKIGLLGMGDSYISGQGTFDYVNGSDTPTDLCHVSRLAYPFLLGQKYYDSYNSVACSGAITTDITGRDRSYIGQAKDQIPEYDRDHQYILNNFLPGYLYQQEFVSTYHPEAMLVSVGGDDIGFADIVKSCVANAGGGTCYDTYEDRAELVGEINATYSKLVNTYETLREQSAGGRLYVVGYPQIAKSGGSCGLNVHLNSDEVQFSAQLINYLDSVIERAAKTAGVFYVDTQQAFNGHRLCESGDKAMNGLTAGGDAGFAIDGHPVNFIAAESYHPTPLGYRLLAQAISQQTQNLRAAMPSATSYEVPSLDSSVDFLQGVPHTDRALNFVSHDDTMTASIAQRGDREQVAVNSSEAQLQPGSTYQIVLHSDPVLLDEGGVGPDGSVSVTIRIPTDTAAGYHTIHLYGTNMAGEAVDIQKQIFIAVNADDLMGTGTPSSCGVVAASGQDSDADGVDDSCDAEITVVSNATVSGIVTVGKNALPTPNVHTMPSAPAIPAGAMSGRVLSDSVGTQTKSKAPSVASLASARTQLFYVHWNWLAERAAFVTIAAATLFMAFRFILSR